MRQKMFERIIGWIFTPLFILSFFGTLLVFHVLQLIALQIGYGPHKFVLDWMNWFIIVSLRIGGNRIILPASPDLPKNGFVVVSNHQSMFDIPMLIWTFRPYHLKFVSKRELGKGIPAISLALRTMGSLMIDRGNQREALNAISAFGKLIAEKRFSVCIFPEGTRARDGVLKPFKTGGTAALLSAMPEAPVVPVVINNSWQMVKFGLLPVGWGNRVSLDVLEPIERGTLSDREIIEQCELAIRKKLEALA
jgi:1-acyl-sn-glycerol-3-phosphate acyltransferase